MGNFGGAGGFLVGLKFSREILPRHRCGLCHNHPLPTATPEVLRCRAFPKRYFKSIFSHLALYNGVVSSRLYFRSYLNLTLPLNCFPHLNHFPRLSYLNQKHPCLPMNQVFLPCLLKRSLRLLIKDRCSHLFSFLVTNLVRFYATVYSGRDKK